LNTGKYQYLLPDFGYKKEQGKIFRVYFYLFVYRKTRIPGILQILEP
jgi:hypothetical protein